MRKSAVLKIVFVLALVALHSCGRKAGLEPDPDLPDACILTPTPADPGAVVTIAITSPVDGRHAPAPRNDSERLVFRQLYEPLIRVDCRGSVRPGLAESWRRYGDGSRWRLELAEDARFWDGTAVTAADVEESMEAAKQRGTAIETGIDSVEIESDRTLFLHFDRPHDHVPHALAELALAVWKRSGSAWPLGTGRYQLAPGAGPQLTSGSTAFPAAGRVGPEIEFRVATAADARDLLEDETELLLTRDPAVIDYAGSLTRLADIPLTWDRTHILLSTSRVQQLRRDEELESLPEEVVDALARDAVRGDARGYRRPSWWDVQGSCPGPSDGPARLPPVPRGAYRPGPRRIVYDRGDSIAQDLANRIVALAGDARSTAASALAAAIPALREPDRSVTAEGLTSERLAATLRAGDDFAYVVRINRLELDPCMAVRRLVVAAEWLGIDGLELSEMLVPLVDSRAHAIVRGESLGLQLDWDGTISIADARRSIGGSP
jgi:hypothetical protein